MIISYLLKWYSSQTCDVVRGKHPLYNNTWRWILSLMNSWPHSPTPACSTAQHTLLIYWTTEHVHLLWWAGSLDQNMYECRDDCQWYRVVVMHFCDLYRWITTQPNMIQQNQWNDFAQNQLHIQMISISRVSENFPKLVKIPLLQTWHFIKILPFWQCPQTLNNLYQQIRHLELNAIVQMILS